MNNDIFRSDIGSEFGEPSSTLPPRIPGSILPHLGNRGTRVQWPGRLSLRLEHQTFQVRVIEGFSLEKPTELNHGYLKMELF